MPRTALEEDIRHWRAGGRAGLGRAFWPFGHEFGGTHAFFDAEAEALGGQVQDAGDEIAFMAEPGGRISETTDEVVVAR